MDQARSTLHPGDDTIGITRNSAFRESQLLGKFKTFRTPK
jgi:hypothetical protein